MPDLFSFAEEHHALFTTDHAANHGLASHDLSRMIGRGRIDRVAPTVYRVRGAPHSWRQQLLITVWSIPGGLASHRAAGALWELDGLRPGRIEAVTPRWERRRRTDGAIVHESLDLIDRDVDEVDGIPCTSLVRTLVDLPAVVHEFRAGQALDHAARVDRSILRQVSDRHAEVARRGRNGTAALRELLAERLGESASPGSGFERRFLRLIGDSALPAPELQHAVRIDGHTFRLDVAWPAAMLGVECDSLAHHFGQHAHERDRRRRRLLARRGWTIIEFTYADVIDRGPMVLRELGHHLKLLETA